MQRACCFVCLQEWDRAIADYTLIIDFQPNLLHVICMRYIYITVYVSLDTLIFFILFNARDDYRSSIFNQIYYMLCAWGTYIYIDLIFYTYCYSWLHSYNRFQTKFIIRYMHEVHIHICNNISVNRDVNMNIFVYIRS